MAETRKSTFENINDLIRILLWPLLIIILFLSFRRELTSIVQQLPGKLQSSSKFSVGSLSFEIERTARSEGSAELAAIISNLSERGIKRLLALGTSSYGFMVNKEVQKDGETRDYYTTPADLEVFTELEKKGLLEGDGPIDEFVKYIRSLKPEEKEMYADDFGSSSEFPGDAYTHKFTELSLPASGLKAADAEKLRRFNIRLSEQGRKAFSIIVNVISEQINKKETNGQTP